MKIEEWAESGRLAEHRHLLPILFDWRRWRGSDDISNYAQSLIEDDRGLIRFIKHFLSEVRSYGMTDYVERVSWRITLESVEKFVGLEEVDKRLRNIKAKPQFNDLEDKEKLVIVTFLDTRDGKIKDSY